MSKIYDSDYSVRLATLGAMGGDTTKCYDSVYEIDLAILDIIEHGGGGAVIDDNVISTETAWSSSKIVSELADAGFDVQVVQTLPATGEAHTLYFVPSADPQTQNVYDEYLYANNAWEQVGSTAVDMSDYYTADEVDALLGDYATISYVDSSLDLKADKTYVDASLARKQDTLTAGTNISITNNSISAKGYLYNASLNSFATGQVLGGGATGMHSHAEGEDTTAFGRSSHSEGSGTFASGNNSHTEGNSTTTRNESEHAEGHFNISHKVSTTYGDAGNTQHSVGIGDMQYGPRNAFEIMQNGDTYLYGVGGYQGVDTKVLNVSIMTVQDYISSRETYVESNFPKLVILTQAQYNALATKDASTLYIISDAQ